MDNEQRTMNNERKLKRELGLLDVFSVAAGAMISSGLFVLPAIAYAKAGAGVILSYFLASILILPAVLCQVELATAMPKSGGTFFYVARSLGSVVGLFSGFADWFSLALKSAFAIVGMAALIEVVAGMIAPVQFGQMHLKVIAIVCCLFFAGLNVISVKYTGRFQVFLVAVLLCILAVFVVIGAGSIEPVRYSGFLGSGARAILATTGLVFISFGGLNKVVNVAEEVHQPGRNLPLGMLLAWFVVTVFYVTTVAVTVGVVEGDELLNSLTPISLAASKFLSIGGFAAISIAAMAAFITTANAGILAASRSPMAMSRDRLLPPVFSSVGRRFKTPHRSIMLTSCFMIIAIVFLDVETLVKAASTLLIILYIFSAASVIVMRESGIQSYRPMFKSPLYPYIHIAAIVAYAALIVDMGRVTLLICAGFVVLSAAWYFIYVSRRVVRASAAMHIVERVTDRQLKTVTLEDELRDILLERDNVIEDRFDRLIRSCEIIDYEGKQQADDVFRKLSEVLSARLGVNEFILFEKFLYREQQGSTIVQPGFAIPHIIIDGENKFDVLLVRCKEGIGFPHTPEPVKIMFVLIGSKDERNYHLRALMAIAQIAQEKDFEEKWLSARGVEGIRNLILLSTRKRDTD
jgi:amino acid transporter